MIVGLATGAGFVEEYAAEKRRSHRRSSAETGGQNAMIVRPGLRTPERAGPTSSRPHSRARASSDPRRCGCCSCRPTSRPACWRAAGQIAGGGSAARPPATDVGPVIDEAALDDSSREPTPRAHAEAEDRTHVLAECEHGTTAPRASRSRAWTCSSARCPLPGCTLSCYRAVDEDVTCSTPSTPAVFEAT